ncbi:hypothetical protein N8865_01005 [Francisellaceae bacterium]|nr:hypothetical protein [Francisellaceae bacterium]
MSKSLAHVVLVNNPDHNDSGDYSICDQRFVLPKKNGTSFTFAGISCFKKSLFEPYEAGTHFRIPDALNSAIIKGLVSSELHHCEWHDVGTPCRLESVSR